MTPPTTSAPQWLPRVSAPVPAMLASRCVRACLLWCCTMLLASCAVQTALPDLQRDTPAKWQGKSAGDAQPPSLQPDLEHWWKAFGDPALNGLVERALQDNLTVQMATYRLSAARSLRRRARSEFWPNLNFRIFEETAPAGSTGYFEMGFDSTWEFGLFGRAQATHRETLADFNSARIDAAAAQVLVIAEVTRNYIELRAAQNRARVLDEIALVRQQQIELERARVHAQLEPATALDRAQGELQQSLSDTTEAAPALVQSQQALAVLLGSNVVEASLLAAAAQPQLPRIGVIQAPADLLRTRPEIRRAEQSVLRAAGELGIARADLYPKLGIAGTLISSTAVTGDLDRPNKATPNIGPFVTIPLFDWGARRDVVNAREAALSAAALAYREAILEGVAEAQIALSLFDAKSLLVDNARTSLSLAQRAAQSQQTLQRLRLSDSLDAASSNLGVAQAQLALIASVRDRALSYVALYKAFGGAMPTLETPSP